jgi:neutral amino acid transport system ATP-binding protein
MNQGLLEVHGVEAGYGEVNVLHGVSIAVPPRAIVAVIGPNGAGKSTLLRSIYGLLPPRAGEIVLRRDGAAEPLAGRRPHELTRLGLNYVPQLDNVFPSMSVLENLEIGAITQGRARRRQVAQALELFPLLAARRRQRAGTLSGGERKQLALARALVTEPTLLLLDEPSAALAPTLVDATFEKLAEINAAGVALVLVEQNARRSLALADYAYVLETGRNRFEGPGAALLHDPQVVELYLGGQRPSTGR